MNRPILVQSKPSFYLHFGKVLGHKVVCWFSCHNREPSGLLKVPYVSLQRNCDNNMPHCSSYACSNSTVKDSISKLFFCYPLKLTRTETVVQWIRWDSHTHSADARRPGWIDPTMKTTSTTRQTSPHLSYVHIHTLRYKIKSLAFI